MQLDRELFDRSRDVRSQVELTLQEAARLVSWGNRLCDESRSLKEELILLLEETRAGQKKLRAHHGRRLRNDLAN
ncbi:MAG: hypothetical protein LAO06_07730 [Acidobacteriia bacterium]|nr:hypothetical protein [Terriglobia bacterium]